jgi:hypothetical protein
MRGPLVLLATTLCVLWCLCGSGQGQEQPTPLYGGQVDVPYQLQIGLRLSGVFPFQFVLSKGSLPDGLSLSPTGLIRGTPKRALDAPSVFQVTVKDATGESLTTVMFSLAIGSTPPVLIVGEPRAAATAPPAPLLASPYQGDDKIRGTASPGAEVEVQRGSERLPGTASQDGAFSISTDQHLRVGESLTATQKVNGAASRASTSGLVRALFRNGEEARAILGYQQSGASAAASTQNFFFDFYISRPLNLWNNGQDDDHDGRLRWWGDVRVASYPQQGDIPVSTFVSTFVQQFGQLKVNQLAQAAEFTGGLEYRISPSNLAFLGRSEENRQRFTLNLIAGFGATGPFNPLGTLSIFTTPALTSPQRARFVQQFPQAASSDFIGFISPDRDEFFRQYFAGIRLTTHYADHDTGEPLIAAPASIAVTFGQNELVTGGRFHGVVGRVEAFYPLPFGSRTGKTGAWSGIYLFGMAQLKLTHADNIEPFVLNPAPGIAGSDPRVAIVTSPSTRDLYRIGVGVDFVHVLTSLIHPNNPAGQGGGSASPQNAGDAKAAPSSGHQ